ncbi:hypothetical protein I4F81_012772 [Pyropia yezoensis]|uniref:Uncharacterized protein n=1 Tax=Pyropia yezoensis TaxID=2788 RepID=A0ACC3CJS4_PYRYE|nr:hypothetical protein I4F81_012772 [Neopyropia yezoensis]
MGHLGPSRYSPPPSMGGLHCEDAGLLGGRRCLLCAAAAVVEHLFLGAPPLGAGTVAVVRSLWAGVAAAAPPLRARGFAVAQTLWASIFVLLAAPLWAVAVVFVRPLRAGAVEESRHGWEHKPREPATGARTR